MRIVDVEQRAVQLQHRHLRSPSHVTAVPSHTRPPDASHHQTRIEDIAHTLRSAYMRVARARSLQLHASRCSG